MRSELAKIVSSRSFSNLGKFFGLSVLSPFGTNRCAFVKLSSAAQIFIFKNLNFDYLISKFCVKISGIQAYIGRDEI